MQTTGVDLGGAAGGLLDLKNRRLTEYGRQLLTGSIDLYRQDFNMDPRFLAPRRRRPVITEIRHVEATAYWDELRRRHRKCSSTPARRRPPQRPEMLAGPCAAPPKRDYIRSSPWEPVPHVRHRLVDPFSRYGQRGDDKYMPGARALPHFTACFDAPARTSITSLPAKSWGSGGSAGSAFRRLLPLTPYSASRTTPDGVQFDCPDLGVGVVQAFRRADSYLSGRPSRRPGARRGEGTTA